VHADFKKAAKAAPAGWFPKVSKVQPYFRRENGTKEEFRFFDTDKLQMHDAKPVPYFIYRSWCSSIFVEITDGNLLADVRALEAECKEIERSKEELTSRVGGLLLSVATVEKFKAIAPELADYVPSEFCTGSSSTALTVDVGGLVQQLMVAGLKVPKGKK